MKQLHFERLNQLLVIACWGEDSTNDMISGIRVPSDEYLITFSDYVKSQLHLNIVTQLYKRKFSEYVKAFYYLEGDSAYKEDIERVLYYFYSDMSSFLINNPNDIKLHLKVDVDIGQDYEVDISDLKQRLQNSNLNSIVTGSNDTDILTDFERDISILIRKMSDINNKPNSCILAYALRKAANAQTCLKFIMKGGYEDGKTDN